MEHAYQIWYQFDIFNDLYELHFINLYMYILVLFKNNKIRAHQFKVVLYVYL